jgi:hypothetical protein
MRSPAAPSLMSSVKNPWSETGANGFAGVLRDTPEETLTS